MFELATKHNSLRRPQKTAKVQFSQLDRAHTQEREGERAGQRVRGVQTVYAALANNLRSSCNTQKFRQQLKYVCPAACLLSDGLNDGKRKFTAGTNANQLARRGVHTHTHAHTARNSSEARERLERNMHISTLNNKIC